jgi:phosphohistidine phosphatase
MSNQLPDGSIFLVLNFAAKARLNMKHLIIVRHAKSRKDIPLLDDFDRPLNDRGLRDAPAMASRLTERGIHPQQMITSPALRALATCKMFAEVLKFPAVQIQLEKNIYHASAAALLSVVRKINERNSEQPVLLFGHNPGLTDLVNDLIEADIDNIPTTGVVSCRLSIDKWSDAAPDCGELDFFDYPKK